MQCKTVRFICISRHSIFTYLDLCVLLIFLNGPGHGNVHMIIMLYPCLRFLTKKLTLLDSTIVTMLPGSRMQEVVRMLPIFLHTMQHLRHPFNELSLVIPVAPHRDVRTYVEEVVQSVPIEVVLIPGESLKERYDAFSVSSLSIMLHESIFQAPKSLV